MKHALKTCSKPIDTCAYRYCGDGWARTHLSCQPFLISHREWTSALCSGDAHGFCIGLAARAEPMQDFWCTFWAGVIRRSGPQWLPVNIDSQHAQSTDTHFYHYIHNYCKLQKKTSCFLVEQVLNLTMSVQKCRIFLPNRRKWCSSSHWELLKYLGHLYPRS